MAASNGANRGNIALGVVLGVLLAALGAAAWIFLGPMPVAVADKPLPFEKFIFERPLARAAAQKLATAPPEADEAVLVGGAEIYRDKCAACHGFYKKSVPFAAHMLPSAPQLWEPRPKSDVVGVSNVPPAESYWKIANGVRMSGMPAYKDLLTDHEIWEVVQLLANANKPLPPGVLNIIRPASLPVLPDLGGAKLEK
jgi:mono/diheme cytochrome c family protein